MADVTQPWGLVHGRINVAVGDSTDAGRAPDKVPVASGLATFTATIDKLVTNTPGQESIDLPQKIVASIVNGALQWGGTDDVSLIASAGRGWQWRVDFSNLRYVDPTTGQNLTLSPMGWLIDVKVYDPAYQDPNTGLNTTITQITDQAPVSAVSTPLLAKGDPGGVMKIVKGTSTTTTDPAAVTFTLTPTADPLATALNMVLPASGGGGGGAGTVTNINGLFPDGTGKLLIAASDIGAASVSANNTAQATASNALTVAQSAQNTAAAAQSTANNAQTSLALKADASALAGYAPLTGATFTGPTKAPTPATSTNDNTVATMAAVRAAITAFAPTGGGTSSTVFAEIVWDPTTQQWLNSAGAAVTSRPNVKLVRLDGTLDAGATLPSWMGTGDQIIPHPDSTLGS